MVDGVLGGAMGRRLGRGDQVTARRDQHPLLLGLRWALVIAMPLSIAWVRCAAMYRTQSTDTDRATEERLLERYRRMTAEEKLEHIGALGRLVTETALAGLREKYPAATERENRLRLLARSLDRETMIRLYGWDPQQQGL